MGMSHGGMAVLETIKKSTTENIPEKPFSAAIAYYPLCGEAAPLNAPGLILIGELDAWTPSNQCIQLFDQHRKQIAQSPVQSHPLKLTVFSQAHHLFDHPGIDQKELGKIIRTHLPSAQKAKELTRDFLITHLPP